MIVRVSIDITIFCEDADDAIEFARQSVRDGNVNADDFDYKIVCGNDPL